MTTVSSVNWLRPKTKLTTSSNSPDVDVSVLSVGTTISAWHVLAMRINATSINLVNCMVFTLTGFADEKYEAVNATIGRRPT